MTAYSLKTASKGCLTAVTLNITMAGDVHDKRDVIMRRGRAEGPYGEVVFEVGRLRANFSNIWLAGPFGVGAQIESTRPYLHLQHADRR